MIESSWEAALDAAQVYEPSERERLKRALILASELLWNFRDRIHKAVGACRNYSVEERRLPLFIEASLEVDADGYQLERELARKVLGPVFRATRVSMPVTLTSPDHAEDIPFVPAGLGILYPTAA